MSESESLTFELPVEILDQIAVQGIQRAARSLVKDILVLGPQSKQAYQFEDLYHWHRYLDAMNTALEYFGGEPVMPVPE
jgi:hypothetical protein